MALTYQIAVAFPKDPAERAKLRAHVGMPMPLYDNSTEMPCTRCAMALLVGPNQAVAVRSGVAKPYCPRCAARLAIELGAGLEYINFKNTAATFERPEDD